MKTIKTTKFHLSVIGGYPNKMYRLKQKLEDFVVKEIPSMSFSKLNSGFYSYFLLKKTDYTTMASIQKISKSLNIPLKKIGFAGNKDRRAVTEQYISIKGGSKSAENKTLGNISLKYLGSGECPISLGDLKGNEFEITIRNLTKEEIEKIKSCKEDIFFPNYFGSQRFSDNNHKVGKEIIKRNFKAAFNLVSRGDRQLLGNYLKIMPNDYIGALRTLPLKIRKMYVNSYQSIMFNKSVSDILKSYENEKKISEDKSMPIIGFGLELNQISDDEMKSIIKKIMEEEKIQPRDFVIREIPELSSEGTERKIFSKVKDFKIIEIKEDELNEGMKKAKVKFQLGKGSYATVVIDYFLEGCKNIIKDVA